MEAIYPFERTWIKIAGQLPTAGRMATPIGQFQFRADHDAEERLIVREHQDGTVRVVYRAGQLFVLVKYDRDAATASGRLVDEPEAFEMSEVLSEWTKESDLPRAWAKELHVSYETFHRYVKGDSPKIRTKPGPHPREIYCNKQDLRRFGWRGV